MHGRSGFLTVTVATLLASIACMSADRLLAVQGAGGAAGAAGTGGAAGTAGAGGAADTAGAGGAAGTAGAGGTWIPFGNPAMVAGLRSVTDDIQDPTLTADELEIYFTSPTGGINDIWRSQRATTVDPWGVSVLVTELSSPEVDEDPELAPDGLSIYLSSDRLGGPGVTRVWFARRAARDQLWGSPQLVLGLGSSSADVAPSVDPAGLMMIFASQRGTNDFHLFSASRATTSAAWEQVVELVDVNSPWQDRDPAVFSRGRGLIFTSRRTGQGRTADLFHVSRSDASVPFVEIPAPITELNTDTWEGDPWISADGHHLLFVSDRNGTSRIYEARR